jgi:DNA-binding response OmpR family regulator
VAVAGISFPTDLENNMSARPVYLSFCRHLYPWFNDKAISFITSTAMKPNGSPRVLYIEDHEDTRELVTLVLEQRRYEVVTGSTIKSGVALAGSQQFDLYLLDSWLPDGSGLELCKQIREFDKATPILFYSAAAYEADRELAIKSGAQEYLIKPSQPSELCNLVTRLIESHRRVQPAA